MSVSHSHSPSQSLFKDLEARGLVKQVTDTALEATLSREPITLYCGFDPTSDSLHIGSLLQLVTLRRFQLAGHRVIALAGGATGMIGDPSGKSAERQLQTLELIDRNIAGITRVMKRFLDLDGAHGAKIVNNADWFKGLSFLDFLRDTGKHFTVNHMMAKESVRARLEDRDHGISYTEFTYMLLQAYDFYILNRDHGCRLQFGGSDQWGNITAGCELIRRMHAAQHAMADGSPINDAPHVFGMTTPLVMKSDGTKFGKTESGTIWLDADKTTPYQFYQYLLQTTDADVGTLLRFFTFLPIDEIIRLEATVKTAPEKREAQTALAVELTKLVHGEEELKKVTQATQTLFSGDLSTMDEKTLLQVFAEAPSVEKTRAELAAGLALIDLLVETGLCASKGAARKDIQGGGIYLNSERVSDVAAKIIETGLVAGRFAVLRKGKKNFGLVKFV